MRALPPLAWILGAFVFFALLVAMYAGSGPERLANPESAWERLEQVRQELESRRLALGGGEEREFATPLYRFRLRRLADAVAPEPSARYLLHVAPAAKIPVDRPWVGAGAEVAFIDRRPGEAVGRLRLVALARTEKLKE